jgi:hypothetical protein
MRRCRQIAETAAGGSHQSNIRTAEYADPTDGKTRPPDDSIRQYEIKVVPGTKSLTFDSSKTTTPWYMRVLGLCDYDVKPGPSECAWRAASL